MPEEMPSSPEPEAPSAAPDVSAEGLSKDAKLFGMLCHLAALAGFVIPFGNIIGPLVIWLIKKDEFPFVDDQGKESLNFQITMAIAGVICIALAFVLIGLILAPLLFLAWVILTILGAVKANSGEKHRYPFAIRLVK